MALFDIGKLEGFLLFMYIFNMTIDESGTITVNGKLQYLLILLCLEALFQFDTLCAHVGSMTMEPLNWVVFGLCQYFFL